MAKSRLKSETAASTNAGASGSQCLFDLDPLQEQYCTQEEQSPNAPRTKQRIARQPKSPTADASEALSLFVDETLFSAKPDKDDADSAAPLQPGVHVRRVSVVSTKKQRISGVQHIRTAAETVCASANAILTVLKDRAYQHIETTAAGFKVEYLLSSVGRSELSRRTGLDRTTLRLAIRALEKRHLVALYEPSDAYQSKPAIYRLCDPDVAAERMRSEDGLSGWRQIGRGRVVY